MPSSSNCGCCANPMCERLLLNILSANALSVSCLNSLSSLRCQEFQHTTTLRSEAFALWLLLARLVVVPAVPKAHKRVWDWLVFSELGWLNTKILSINVWLP